jgi:hypothetical protein
MWPTPRITRSWYLHHSDVILGFGVVRMSVHGAGSAETASPLRGVGRSNKGKFMRHRLNSPTTTTGKKRTAWMTIVIPNAVVVATPKSMNNCSATASNAPSPAGA